MWFRDLVRIVFQFSVPRMAIQVGKVSPDDTTRSDELYAVCLLLGDHKNLNTCVRASCMSPK